jgi:hypothetical protein
LPGYLPIYLWFYSPLLDLGRFFSFLILYTVGRTLRKANQPFARPLPTHGINSHRHPCFEWDSNPRSQLAKTVRALDRAATVIGLPGYRVAEVTRMGKLPLGLGI